MSCEHGNARIMLYEEQSTRYTLQAGVITDIDDDIEAQPLLKADVSCPDCQLSVTYPNWHQAPEPLLNYCQRIFQQEYGVPVKAGA